MSKIAIAIALEFCNVFLIVGLVAAATSSVWIFRSLVRGRHDIP